MKLLTRTNRYFLFLSLAAFGLGSVVLVLVLNALLTNQLDENLLHRRSLLKKELLSKESVPQHLTIMEEVVELVPIPGERVFQEFKDTSYLVEDDDDDELERVEYRKYVYSEWINGQNYRIQLSHSKFESDDLAVAIITFNLALLLFLVLCMYAFNRLISRRIWLPFFDVVDQIKNFRIQDGATIKYQDSGIDEFDQLSKSAAGMTEKLARDYQALKRFGENASHEIQTPLAIILAQTDLLVQRSDLDESSAAQLAAIQHASKRISQLNRTMLLLSKIENRQFPEITRNSYDKAIQRELEVLAPLIDHKKITLRLNLAERSIQCNAHLLASLIQNILSNAIKHNRDYGSMEVSLTEDTFLVKNTSNQIGTEDTSSLFERFHKGNPTGSSPGLGLAIVKEICDFYNWQITYTIEGDYHKVAIIENSE